MQRTRAAGRFTMSRRASPGATRTATMYVTDAAGSRYSFRDLRQLLAAASPDRSGDRLAGIAAASAEARVAARYALMDVPLKAFLEELVVPYETDEVSRLIVDTHDRQAFAPVATMTVGEFRDWLLSDAADGAALRAL